MDFQSIQSDIIKYGMKAIIGLIILFVGFKAVNFLTKKIGQFFEHKGYDPSLRPFLSSLISWTLKIAVFIVAANQMGIETTSFVALLGAAGLAIGIALQGSLSNFSGGVMLLLLRPFHVGDLIESQGFSGTVSKITIFNTILKTADNQIIFLPNGPLSNNPIRNVTREEVRRVDFVFGISYGDDIDQVKTILQKDFLQDQRILKTPVPEFFVKELAESSVNLGVRVWVKTSDYWQVYFDHNESVKKTFDSNGITIPFPQTDFNIIETKLGFLSGEAEQSSARPN